MLVAAAVGVVLLSRTSAGPRFRTLRNGVEFATLRGDPYCRMGSSEIAVLRLDPDQVRLSMLHYTQSDPAPLPILDWEQRTRCIAVFNAGQYYPDYSYMGLFVSGGRAVSSTPHPGFKAALVSEPPSGGPKARVLDLDEQPIRPEDPGWREVAQSFMLFDSHGRIRVRKSPNVSYRTIVAEDSERRLLVFATEGGYTLYELAGLLQRQPLGLRRAMSMDGGEESVLCVNVAGFRYASFGHRRDDGEVPNPARSTVPLPAVVAVLPR